MKRTIKIAVSTLLLMAMMLGAFPVRYLDKNGGFVANALDTDFVPDGSSHHLADVGNFTDGYRAFPTPDQMSADYLGNFIQMSRLKTALFFDDNLTDHVGKLTATENGTISYQEGFAGKAAVVSEGYISLPELKFGADSFAIALWMKKTGTEERDPWNPVLFGNKDMSDGLTPGFALCERKNGTFFCVADGEAKTDADSLFAEDNGTDWTHVILSVDRESQTVFIYYNFELVNEITLDEGLEGKSFDSDLPFHIGQDGTGNDTYNTDSLLDDFLVFDGSLSAEDIQDLKSYYLPEGAPAPTRAYLFVDKATYEVGEEIAFHFYGNGTSNCFYWYAPEENCRNHVFSPYTMSFDTPGIYSAMIETVNEYGSRMSQRVTFRVVDPSDTPMYSVVFKNWDEEEISSDRYFEGDIVRVPDAPVREGYIFTGWDRTVEAVCTGDATYTAQFVAADAEFTVTFKGWDDEDLSTNTYTYGQQIAIPEDPPVHVLDGKQYIFLGWDQEVSKTCVGDITYTAVFYVLGDVNQDDDVSVSDMIAVKAYLLGKGSITDVSALAADVSGDGEISITDFILIKAALLGKSNAVH